MRLSCQNKVISKNIKRSDEELLHEDFYRMRRALLIILQAAWMGSPYFLSQGLLDPAQVMPVHVKG
jgi:hypothetical protein